MVKKFMKKFMEGLKMNKNEAKRKLGELKSSIFWHYKKDSRISYANIEEIEKEAEAISMGLKHSFFSDEVNELGNVIERGFNGGFTRYSFDFKMCSYKDGWKQYDTTEDGPHFGIWVHPGKLKIVTFCEGDIILITCKNEQTYHEEIQKMNEFYGPTPPSIITYQFQDGVCERTEIICKRPQ